MAATEQEEKGVENQVYESADARKEASWESCFRARLLSTLYFSACLAQLPEKWPPSLCLLPFAWTCRLERGCLLEGSSTWSRSSRGELGFSARIMLPCWPRNSCKATEKQRELSFPKLWECLYVTD